MGFGAWAAGRPWLGGGFGGAVAAIWVYVWEALAAADAMFRGCNLLGMVSFSLDAQNGGVDILEHFSECQRLGERGKTISPSS